MPHIILEHSNNVVDKINYQEFCINMHKIFMDNGYTNPNALKSRYVIHDKYYIGDNIENFFIHLNISVLKGKSNTQLQNIIKNAKKLLHDTFKISNNQKPTAFSVEIREMNNELYLK